MIVPAGSAGSAGRLGGLFLDAIAEAVSGFVEAGFTDVALVQVGDASQEQLLAEAAGPLLERLRSL